MEKLLSAFRNLFRRKKAERELDAEVRSYASMLEDENRAAGMNAAHARREANIALGGIEQVKEQARAARAGTWLESIWRDLRFALRMLRKNPGFTAVAVATLALGIGANTAIFSVMESQLWRPLPFPDSERVYELSTRPPDNPTNWYRASGPEFLEWRARAHSFDHLAAWDYPAGQNFSAGRATGRAFAMRISSDFFETLQIQPVLGRAFRPSDNLGSADFSVPQTLMPAPQQRIAIVSYHLWRDAFHLDPAAVGSTIILDGVPHTVVGVAPEGMRLEFIVEPDVFVPLRLDQATAVGKFSNDTFSVIGHLAPGVAPEKAAAEMNVIIQSDSLAPSFTSRKRVLIFDKERIIRSGGAAQPLYFFAGAAVLVLLIACVNLASLLLARGLARQQEFALRAVLGARRSALMRQQFVETLALALLGGSAGILLSVWFARGFTSLISEDWLPRGGEVHLDLRVVVVTFAATICAAILLGMAPAAFASKAGSGEAIRQTSRSFSGNLSQRRTRTYLVVAEVALALVLLFGAGLFLGSFLQQQEAPLGFDPNGILTMRIMLRGPNYITPEEQRIFYGRVSQALRAIPGARSVAVSSDVPLSGGGDKSFTIAGVPAPEPSEEPYAATYTVTPEFFDLFHITFLAGRGITKNDVAGAPRVAVVNRNFAEQYFPDDSPVGKVINFIPGGYGPLISVGPAQIVGVVENSQRFGANEIPFASIYLPFTQSPAGKTIISVKSDLSPEVLLPSIRQAVAAIDADQPVYDTQTMLDRVNDSVSGARLNLFLVAGLAVVAALLVSIGIFGTVAYFVRQRTQEFGIRLALGASPSKILRHVLAQSLAMGTVGLSIGVAVSLGLGRLLKHALYLAPHEHPGMLYGISIYDPTTLASVCVLLAAVLTLASFLPARRAMKLDPMVALRHE